MPEANIIDHEGKGPWHQYSRQPRLGIPAKNVSVARSSKSDRVFPNACSEEAVYACPKGRGGSSCNFFIWVTEAQVAEASKGYTFNESKVRSLRGAATTPKRLKQTLLPGAPPPSRNIAPGRTRSGACYTRVAAAPVLPPKALAPPSPPSRVKRRRESSPPSNEVSEQKPGPCKLRRPNRVTKNPYSTNNSRASTPKPPPSSTSSRKAVAVTRGTWDHRSVAWPLSETDVDEDGSDNNATVTPSLSPAPSPRRRLFNSNGEPTTPRRRAADMRTTPWTPRSRNGSFFSGALSTPGRGVQFDVREAVSEFIRTEGIDLKGAGGKLWDILEREVGQKEGVCKGYGLIYDHGIFSD